MAKVTAAYAGSASTRALPVDTATGLLDVLLPNDLGLTFIPAKVTRAQPVLRGVVEWLNKELEKGPEGEDATIPVDNLVEALLQRNEKLAADGDEPDELRLYIAFDPASGLDNITIKEAHDAGVLVFDLAKAGEQIYPPEPEVPEPAAEEPPFDTGPADLGQDNAAQATVSPGDVVAAAAKAGVEAARAAQINSAGSALGSVTLTVTIPPEAVLGIAAAIATALAAHGVQAPATDAAPGIESVKDALPGTFGDQADVKPTPDHRAYYYQTRDVDGPLFRPARGKAQDGEVRKWLSPMEIEELKKAGQLG